jgi:hypothetical protein
VRGIEFLVLVAGRVVVDAFTDESRIACIAESLEDVVCEQVMGVGVGFLDAVFVAGESTGENLGPPGFRDNPEVVDLCRRRHRSTYTDPGTMPRCGRGDLKGYAAVGLSRTAGVRWSA